jgi:hypothetical protein
MHPPAPILAATQTSGQCGAGVSSVRHLQGWLQGFECLVDVVDGTLAQASVLGRINSMIDIVASLSQQLYC